MNYGDIPPSREAMVAAIVGQVQYWDLDILIDWVQEEMGKMLDALDFEELYNEYTFVFEEE